MAKRRGIRRLFQKRKKNTAADITVTTGGQADMPLPPVLGTVLRGITRAAPSIISSMRSGFSATGAPTVSSVQRALGVGGRRRRRGISTAEMGKIMFLSQTLGKRSPAVTWAVMKAIGGKI